MHNLRSGDWVIYRKSKQSTSPGPRAHRVTAAAKGDSYGYVVDKFWIVDSVHQDGTVTLRTRRGKLHRLPSDDPNLRKAGFFMRLLNRNRFREIHQESSASGAVPV